MVSSRLGVNAVLFDLFGTVLDWRGSLVRQLAERGAAKGIEADWPELVDDWRRCFRDKQGLTGGSGEWLKMDEIHRQCIVDLAPRHRLGELSEGESLEYAQMWHRLDPWPDIIDGLARLRALHVAGPLSNGNFAMLVDASRNAGLQWDCVLSTELIGQFKPHPDVYRRAAELLELPAERVLMAAAHEYDLDGAAKVGMRTAYVHRPLEWGEGRTPQPGDLSRFDLEVRGLEELADRLGC